MIAASISGVWVLMALASSIFSAQNVEMNRRARQEGFRLNFWRTALSALFWLPLAMVQPWPHDAFFYVCAVFSGMAMIVGFTIQNDLAVKHNGRIAILHTPIKAIAVFLVWLMIDETARHHVFDNLEKTLGVMACLAVMVMALFTFRRNDVSWSSLKAVMPIVLLYGLGDILSRLNLSVDELNDKLVVFLFVMTTTSALVSALLSPWRPHPDLPWVSHKMLYAAGWAGFLGTLNQVCFYVALVSAPNPAYVSMISLLTPVWLLLYHRLAHIKDDASPIAGMMVVAAAITLMVLTI